MFGADYLLCDAVPSQGYCLSAFGMFRGNFDGSQIEEQISSVQNAQSNCYLPWIPQSMKHSHCPIAPKGLTGTGTLLTNSTSIKQMFKRIASQFLWLIKKKSFMHYYLDEGAEEGEFLEAQEDVENLIRQYEWLEENPLKLGDREEPKA